MEKTALPRPWSEGGTLEIDKVHRIQNANVTFFLWLGASLEELIGTTVQELF